MTGALMAPPQFLAYFLTQVWYDRDRHGALQRLRGHEAARGGGEAIARCRCQDPGGWWVKPGSLGAGHAFYMMHHEVSRHGLVIL